MVKEEVTYRDFMGTERTEEFYFNISMTEALKWQNSADGGLAEKIRKIINAADNREVANIYEDFILTAYGELADDGRTFVKYDLDGHRLADRFRQSAAYDALFTKLLFNQESAEKFISGVVDPELANRMKELEENKGVMTPTKQVIAADFSIKKN